MATFSENQINLKTLQRVDSNIIEIIDNACQVAIYKYERKLEKWEGTDIEGALFLYRRALYPYFGFIIVNRMSTTNFVESLTSDMQIQLQEPYLLYQNHSGDIIGSWFYERRDLLRISKKIQTIILKETSSTPKRQRCASESESQPQNVETRSQDIMTLLSEAHEEFIKNSNNHKSPENNCEDVNSLSAYSEKKSLEKSISVHKKQENTGAVLRKYSSEVHDPVSPRRRFMSTGSFDPDRANLLSYMFLSNQKRIEEDEIKKCNIVEKSFHSKTANDSIKEHVAHPSDISSPPKQMSSFLNHDHVASPTLNASAAANELLDPHFENHYADKVHLQSSAQGNQDWRTEINGDTSIHFASIKNALKSHIEENPKVMLKIHEAYVSSLKSLFTNSSC